MPVISLNLSHDTYNKLVEGARQYTEGNISLYLRDYCTIRFHEKPFAERLVNHGDD